MIHLLAELFEALLRCDISFIHLLVISYIYALHYVSIGWAAPSSSWEGLNWLAPYAVARMDISGYAREESDRYEHARPTPMPAPYPPQYASPLAASTTNAPLSLPMSAPSSTAFPSCSGASQTTENNSNGSIVSSLPERSRSIDAKSLRNSNVTRELRLTRRVVMPRMPSAAVLERKDEEIKRMKMELRRQLFKLGALGYKHYMDESVTSAEKDLLQERRRTKRMLRGQTTHNQNSNTAKQRHLIANTKGIGSGGGNEQTFNIGRNPNNGGGNVNNNNSSNNGGSFYYNITSSSPSSTPTLKPWYPHYQWLQGQ